MIKGTSFPIKMCLVVAGVCLIAIITMSFLGATNYSLHLINLNNGWTGKLWDALWMTLTASTFFILGILFHITTNKQDGGLDADS